MTADPQTQRPRQPGRAFAVMAMLVAATLALEAGFAKWLRPGSALDGGAQWAVLLFGAACGSAVAHKSGHGRLVVPLVLVLLIVFLFCGTLLLECTLRQTGCDL